MLASDGAFLHRKSGERPTMDTLYGLELTLHQLFPLFIPSGYLRGRAAESFANNDFANQFHHRTAIKSSTLMPKIKTNKVLIRGGVRPVLDLNRLLRMYVLTTIHIPSLFLYIGNHFITKKCTVLLIQSNDYKSV